MKIKELYIRGFGKFRDSRIELKEGINLISGKNESGKSTIHAFIRGMFFGLRRLRGRASRDDSYSRYEPWEHPGFYGGELRFESGGKLFRLSRNFSRGQTSEQLVCDSDGEVLSIEEGDLEVLLGGISERVFDNTISVSQLRSVTDQGLAMELNNYMVSYQGTADGALDLKKAEDYLKAQRRKRESELREKRKDQERTQQEIQYRLAGIREEIRRLQRELRDLEGQSAGSPSRQQRKESARPWVIRLLAAFLVLAAAGSMLFIREASLEIWAGRAGACLLAAFLAVCSFRKRVSGKQAEEPEWKREFLRQELEEKERSFENTEQEYREFCELCGKKEGLETELEAVSLAEKVIRQLSAEIQKQAGSALKKRVSELLCSLTEGRYRAISLEGDLQMTLYSEEAAVPLSRVSRGTVEQVYLALRLAAAELLCPEEELPLLLDEVFALYDDRRLCQALRLLAAQDRQVLLFSCQNREEIFLKQLKIPYHKIVLQEEKTEC